MTSIYKTAPEEKAIVRICDFGMALIERLSYTYDSNYASSPLQIFENYPYQQIVLATTLGLIYTWMHLSPTSMRASFNLTGCVLDHGLQYAVLDKPRKRP